MKQWTLEERYRVLKSPEEISAYRLIVDLTNEGDWLEPEWLQEDLIMAAPGVPLSLKAEAAPAFADRVVHDDLEIGTAVMAMEALMDD